MKTLSSTLLAAQQSPSRRPYVKVEVVDRLGTISRLDWQRLYSGSEPDFHHAAAVAGDGSLLRARLDPATLWISYMRVANPGPGSDFSQWQSLSYGSAGLALAAQGAEVFLFWGAPSPNQDSVYYRRSTDYGENFGQASNLGSPEPGVAVGWIAAAHKPNGDIALFASAGVALFTRLRLNGVWGNWEQWTNYLSAISGVATCYQGDWNLAVAGADLAGNRGVWTCIYGDGSALPAGWWSALQLLTLSSPAANIQFRCPSLAYPDVYRLFFVEKHSGQQTYQRPFWCHTLPGDAFSAYLWREPIPFDLSSEYGLAIVGGASGHWLSSPFGVWQGTVSTAAVEVTTDVVGLTARTEPFSGSVRVELDNASGKYNSLGSGALAAIKEGSQLKVSPGYYTAAGAEVVSPWVYWIEGWEYIRDGRGSRLVLEGREGWGLLAAWKARRQFGWAAGEKSVLDLLTFFLARAGLKLTVLSQSPSIGSHSPAFTLHPGATGAEAVRRLLERVPDLLFVQGEVGALKNPDPEEATAYNYGGAHPILACRHSRSSPRVNRVQAYGSGVVVEVFSWPEVDRVLDRLLQVHDLNLSTAAEAGDRAEAELKAALRAATADEVAVAVNCGQELYDVVEVTDPQVGLASVRRRVSGMELFSSPWQGGYQLRLRLSEL